MSMKKNSSDALLEMTAANSFVPCNALMFLFSCLVSGSHFNVRALVLNVDW